MSISNRLQDVTHGQAQKLKALGFDWLSWVYCAGDDSHYCHGLTVALALKWARDVKKVLCGVMPWESDSTPFYEGRICQSASLYAKPTESFDTYDAAESALLDAVIAELERRAGK